MFPYSNSTHNSLFHKANFTALQTVGSLLLLAPPHSHAAKGEKEFCPDPGLPLAWTAARRRTSMISEQFKIGDIQKAKKNGQRLFSAFVKKTFTKLRDSAQIVLFSAPCVTVSWLMAGDKGRARILHLPRRPPTGRSGQTSSQAVGWVSPYSSR